MLTLCRIQGAHRRHLRERTLSTKNAERQLLTFSVVCYVLLVRFFCPFFSTRSTARTSSTTMRGR